MRAGDPCSRLLFCLFALLPVHFAQADTIVDQPLSATDVGEFSNLGPSNQQAADDFLLTTATTLDSLTWYGRYGNASISVTNPVTFAIRFFGDSGGSPTLMPVGSYIVDVNASATGSDFGGIPWYSYTTGLGGWTLDPGKYWVSILENDTDTAMVGATQWLWADTSTNGDRAIRYSDSSAWSTGYDVNHAFTIEGTPVPEPATVLLFALAVPVIVCVRRRRSARPDRQN